MKLTKRQERVFVNRYGTNIYEDILHFSSTKNTKNPIERTRNVAYKILNSVISCAPDESENDLKDALEKIGEIQPSPILKTKELIRN
jgi:hypothetical protein